jgi:hypothetical protein
MYKKYKNIISQTHLQVYFLHHTTSKTDDMATTQESSVFRPQFLCDYSL